MAKKKKTKSKRIDKRYNVYVIELDPIVLKKKKFAEKNPDHVDNKACLYVGMTSHTPDVRFEQHKSGYKACKFVKSHGLHLRRKMFEKYNPMTRDEVEKKEVDLAIELRRKGYAVWQH